MSAFLEVLVGIIIVDTFLELFSKLVKSFITSEPLSGQIPYSNQAVNDPINYYFEYINNIYDNTETHSKYIYFLNNHCLIILSNIFCTASSSASFFLSLFPINSLTIPT